MKDTLQLRYNYKGYYAVDIKERGTFRLRGLIIIDGVKVYSAATVESAIAIEYKITKILAITKGDIIVEVELIKDYKLPNNYFVVSEQNSKGFYNVKGWRETEEEALEFAKQFKYYQICEAFLNNYVSYIKHEKIIEVD